MKLEQTQFLTWRHILFLRVRFLLLGIDFEIAEIITGVIALGGGLVWLNPFVDTFVTSQNYAAMRGLPGVFGGEGFWGALAIGLGLLTLLALFTGRVRGRRWAMLGLILFYCFIGVSFFASNPWSWGFVQVAVLLAVSLWAQWRLALLPRPSWM